MQINAASDYAFIAVVSYNVFTAVYSFAITVVDFAVNDILL